MTLRAPAAALLTALTTAVVAAAPPALAAGRMRAGDRHLSIESQIVRVDVEDGLVTTEVEQVFRNDADEPAEAVYDLPLPPDSAFSGLAIWVDGQPVEGEVVERSRAEAIYREETGVEVTLREGKSQAERLVAIRSVDPALLQVHGRLLRLRVSPVPARGTQRVRARYVQPLRGEGETARVIYPLAHEGVEAAVAGRLDCRVRVRSSAPVARVYSPSHPEADVANPVPGSAFELAFSERGARLDRDLEVRIDRLQQPGPRLRVLAAREPGARLGTAQLALTPWLPPVYRSPRRDVVLVVDDSASMDDRRARAAALVDAALAGLDDGDRFTVVRLGLSARPWQRRLVPLSAANRRAARAFVAAAGRRGQADPRVLAGALARLAKSDRGGRPLDVVLLTDPALSDHPQALDEVARRARATGVRVFAVELGGSTAPRRRWRAWPAAPAGRRAP